MHVFSTEDTNPLPVRVVQDGLSGETVLVPLPATNDPSYNPYLHRVACTTTPFGFPVRTREEVAARYLDPAAWFDEAVRTRMRHPAPLGGIAISG